MIPRKRVQERLCIGPIGTRDHGFLITNPDPQKRQPQDQPPWPRGVRQYTLHWKEDSLNPRTSWCLYASVPLPG
jgi:hypothetical protein